MTKHTAHTPSVLEDPLLNRGPAFTETEREALGLTGRLPSAVLTLEQQARRVYEQLQRQPTDLAKNVYLEQLHDRNEVLYYKVLADRLAELLPVVYDPTVGDAIERYSHEYRRPRGIYLSIDQPDDIEKAFATLGLGPGDVDLIVCTDAEEILGIGDSGVGRNPDLGRQAGRLHRRGRSRPAAGDPGVAGRGYRQRRAAERPAVPGQPARPGPREGLRRVHREIPAGRVAAVPGRAAALRGLRREQRPADPGQLPGQIPDLQRRHAGHRRRGHGRAVQRAEGHRHPVAGPAGRGVRRRHRRGWHRRSDPRADDPGRAGCGPGRPADLDRGPARPADRRHGRGPAGLPASLRPPGRRGGRAGPRRRSRSTRPPSSAGRRWPRCARRGPPQASSPCRP